MVELGFDPTHGVVKRIRIRRCKFIKRILLLDQTATTTRKPFSQTPNLSHYPLLQVHYRMKLTFSRTLVWFGVFRERPEAVVK